MAKQQTDQIVGSVENLFKKLPNLPENIREFLAMITPWLALVFGILGVLAGVAAFGVVSFLSPFIALGAGLGAAGNSIVFTVLFLASSVLMLAAFPGLKARKLGGWNLLFWSEAVTLVSAVLALSLSSILGVLIGFYLLFQIKKFYK